MDPKCYSCGYCCSYMDEVYGIIEKSGPYEYLIQYLITGVEQIVSIDIDKQWLFLNGTINDKRPMACSFLREINSETAICSIYSTRPELCRMYHCSRCKEVGE
ncbi:MAG TPA: YkgJ family cysteine cluster protein [Methanospirillum sp.]|nr:YkgJ family cysteine cluster protein [Methanospirillum sp.]